ncbi:MAG: DUF2520 domain-containing protein [Bacteroidota bacterium]|nr:DUF2520 domain-containing protein [Bacteroidota bacterium]
MRVVMVGSGNAATVLCEVIVKAGHHIVQVASRDADHARLLASSYTASSSSLYVPAFENADIYIVALHDAALDHIENIPGLKNKLVVHTAGAISIEALKNCSNSYGVLYPLQTLSKSSDRIPEIPFLVDGNNQETLHRILGFAKTLSNNVMEAKDAERMNYHVAAVFVSNFTNHMYTLAETLCQKERLDFRTLLPVINEVNKRVNNNSPYLNQTGPAMRDDIFTLNKHLQALTAYPDLKYIYLKLSESIIKIHDKR